MKATFLKELPTSRDMLSVFGGYDGRARISEGTFGDMLNLSSQHYPVMSTRRERAWLKDIEGLQGVLAKDKLAWVANKKLYDDGVKVPGANFTDGKKKMVSMGANIIIYPDQIQYNTATGECVRLYRDEQLGGASIYIEVPPIYNCERYTSLPEGTPIDTSYVPSEGDLAYYYYNKNTKRPAYYQYIDGQFLPLKIKNAVLKGEGAYLSSRISVETIKKNGGIRIFSGVTDEILFSAKTFFKVGIDEYIKGNLNREFTCEEIYKKLGGTEYLANSSNSTPNRIDGIKTQCILNYPEMKLDGIFESGNRLWGYRYGENSEGEFVNEIYSTALGEPIGWDTFEGIASDSYAVSVGSDGPFTGAIEYSGSLYFFKENYMHRLMGLKPSSYQLNTLSCHGVEEGSERSLVRLGDALYYKGNDGIYCYDGSIPYRISEVFGEKRYKNAVGGVLGSLVFMDMENEQGKRVMFVYDTLKRLWHIEESTEANEFISAFGNLIYRNERGLGAIFGDELDRELTELFGDEIRREGAFKWFGEFGDFGLSSPDAKYVSKLQLRMTVDEGARVAVEVMTDSDGSWTTVQVISAQNKRSVCLPIVTPRCDHFRLRLSGEGGFKLWSLTKETESTNEVR